MLPLPTSNHVQFIRRVLVQGKGALVEWRQIAADAGLDADEAKALVNRLAVSGHCDLTFLGMTLTPTGRSALRSVVEYYETEDPEVLGYRRAAAATAILADATEVAAVSNSKSHPIFVSHSSQDKDLVDAFVTMLTSGGVATPDDILCSSLEGMGIPKGMDFKQFIHTELRGTKLVIALVTRNFYDSAFCMCELGATWALSNNFYPLIVPPLGHADLKAVLMNTNVGSTGRKEDLSDVGDRVAGATGRALKPGLFEQKRDKFLASLDSLIKTVVKPRSDKDMVLAHAINAARAKNQFPELTTVGLKAPIPMPLPESVAVESARSSPSDDLKALLGEARLAVSTLPLPAQFAMFKNRHHQFWDGKDAAYDPAELADAIESGYVRRSIYDQRYIEPNEDDVSVKRARKAMNRLESYFQNASKDWRADFEETHGFPADPWNKRLWKTYFRLSWDVIIAIHFTGVPDPLAAQARHF